MNRQHLYLKLLAIASLSGATMVPLAYAQEEAAEVEAAPIGAAVEIEVIADPAEAEVREALMEIARSDHRPERNSVRDIYRHPVETLAFFGIRRDMTVVEITPGGGWYLQIIAPYLRDQGLYYAANSSAESWWPLNLIPWTQNGTDRMRARLNENEALYGKIEFSVVGSDDGIAPAESADLVLTFRNVHNWMMGGREAAVFADMYAALKPGGILGVIEHRGDPEGSLVLDGTKGYVAEADVVKFAEAAGFEFLERSEINANPADPRDHESGVWTLPPTFALGDQDREQYLAIGESDRMTMKFRKPLN